MAARVFAVLAALLLVAAVAAATLLPQGTTLAQTLVMVDRGGPNWMHEHSTAWLWTWAEQPFLVRPIWLIPSFLGLICAGMATTLNVDASPRRRRS